jgi:hypothetical protein
MTPPAPYLFKSARSNVREARHRQRAAAKAAGRRDVMHTMFMSRMAKLSWTFAVLDVVRLLLGDGA